MDSGRIINFNKGGICTLMCINPFGLNDWPSQSKLVLSTLVLVTVISCNFLGKITCSLITEIEVQNHIVGLCPYVYKENWFMLLCTCVCPTTIILNQLTGFHET